MEKEQQEWPQQVHPLANEYGPITKADLYDLDVRLGERFTAIQTSINGLAERMTLHEALHQQEQREIIVSKEVKLDAKKAGVVGFIAMIGAGIAAVVKVLTQ